MKKLSVWLAGCLLSLSTGFSQTKSSLVVAKPTITGLDISPEVALKLLTVESIKLEKYTVFDEFEAEDVIAKHSKSAPCRSKECLLAVGQEIGADFVLSSSFDLLINKIIITVRLLDVSQGKVTMSSVREYDNQEQELQRMIEILLKEMHQLEVTKEVKDRLSFKNEAILSNNVGKVNNSGPRVGYAFMAGSLNEFATRSADEGGLDIFPGVSMIGYQLEGQYVGTENFSALIEGVVNVSGLEQAQFIPSIAILNGFRFVRAGWEIAFGPSFGVKRMSYGFFDSEGKFGRSGGYVSNRDYNTFLQENYPENPGLQPSDFYSGYNFKTKHADNRGDVYLNTAFVFAMGRTFRSGALNFPVNVFYSSQRKGGLLGLSVGFNVMKSKKPINKLH